MKKIEAIIRPSKLDEVKDALAAAGVSGITITEVRGFGHQKGFMERFRVSEVYVNVLPKVQLKMVVREDQVEKVVDTLLQTARTGEIGDGKVFVTTVDEVYRIRTGERDKQAL